MEYPFFIDKENKQGGIIASKEYFTRDAVLLVAEQYSKKYYVSFFPDGEQSVKITLFAKHDDTITEILLRELMNTLIDYQIKIDLEKEFGEIKKKIVDYAFSSVE